MRKIMTSSALALSVWLGAGQSNVFGIVISSPEHIALGEGATDAEHIAMAARPEFQASGWFSYTDSASGGTARSSAVLVSPNWVVTAQHNILRWNPDSSSTTVLPLSGVKVGFGSDALTDTTSHSVTQAIRVPGYDFNDGKSDLVFLKLATPVTDVAPVRLFTGTLSAGQQVATIGHGQPGSPAAGLLDYDGIERGMVNPLRSRTELNNFFPYATDWLMTQFEGDPLSSNYEYFGGSVSLGDDGGGLFVLDNGEWKLAGVTAFDYGAPSYGSYSLYTDMTAYINWISSQAALASIIPEPVGVSSFLLIGAFAFLTRRSKATA